jgi:hypothetical protein
MAGSGQWDYTDFSIQATRVWRVSPFGFLSVLGQDLYCSSLAFSIQSTTFPSRLS